MDTYQNINTTALVGYTTGFASNNLIDGTDNMANDRVFILSGINDTTVRQGAPHTHAHLYYPQQGRITQPEVEI